MRPFPFPRPPVLALALLLVGLPLAAQPATEVGLRIDFDATDLSRGLLTSRVEIAVPEALVPEGGSLVLWYPKWVPGVHAPGGPVQNIGGLSLSTLQGTRLAWEREPGEVYRLRVEVPADQEWIEARITYIANQSETNSHGIDTFGSPSLGFVSPNTALLYREDQKSSETLVATRLRYPSDWSIATALQPDPVRSDDTWQAFEVVSLETLVDSPIMMGEHYRLYELTPEGGPSHHLHLFSERESATELDEKVSEGYRWMVAEASALFGSHPYETYDFLVAASDELPNNGLEHLSSSFNVVSADALSEAKWTSWERYLLPHEYAHAWSGKYRRPAGMDTDDFHTPKDTRLLWAYEGLAEYVGAVIDVRAGMTTAADFAWRMQQDILRYRRQQGRAWRSLEDTASASWILRARSKSWGHLRRSQDYYSEGALMWLEIDARLRCASKGRITLDDYIQAFYRYEPGDPRPKPHGRTEIVDTLTVLVDDIDWAAIVDARVRDLDAEAHFGDPLLEVLGLDLQTVAEKPEPPKGVKPPRWSPTFEAIDSLGFMMSKEAEVRIVMKGSPADRAGLGPGMKVVGVGDFVYSPERLEAALEATPETGSVELLLEEGERLVRRRLAWDQGPQYLALEAREGHDDILAAIAAPRVRPEEKDDEADSAEEDETSESGTPPAEVEAD